LKISQFFQTQAFEKLFLKEIQRQEKSIFIRFSIDSL